MFTRPLFVCALMASLCACEETFAPETSGPSSFVFDYTGLGTEPADVFVAEGEFPGDNILEKHPGNWAFAARRGNVDRRMVVTAARDRPDGRFDLLTLELPLDARRGQTLQFREQCAEADCAKMWISFGVAVEDVRSICFVVSGEARVQTLTDRRVVGSFSGTANCIGATGQMAIQRGAFDVAVIQPAA